VTSRRALFLLIVLATSLARSQDPPGELTLRRAVVNGEPAVSVEMGSLVTLEGTNLHACPPGQERRCTHDDLSVTVARREAMIAACTSESLTVLLPYEHDYGDQLIKVTRRGAWPAATATLRLNIRPRRPSGRTDPWPLPHVIDRFELVRSRGGERFEVVGRIGDVSPDGGQGGALRFTLSLADRVIAQQPLIAASPQGHFGASFGPFAREVLAGAYTVELRLGTNTQDQLERRGFERRSGPTLCSATLEVGTSADADRQRRRAVDGYRALAADLVALRAELDQARVRELLSRLRLPWGLQPPAFDATSHDRWLTTRLLPELDRVRHAAREIDDLTFVPVFVTARERLERLVEVLVESSRADGGARPPRIGFDVELDGLLRVLGLED
jgi:hypothetical protein